MPAGRGCRIGRRLALLLALAAPVSAAAAQTYRSLTDQFAAFADATAGQPMAARIAAFRADVVPLFPAFYRPRDGRSADDFDRMIAHALDVFPRDRAGIAAVERKFADSYGRELARFGRAFPDFHLTSQVYLLHSLGELDAGTRMLGGRRVLIFAADGIAAADPPDSLPMLFDHEFFHMAHSQAFSACPAVWCTLWREGLAVYAAAVLNPGSSDRQLGLDDPALLRPAVEADRPAALCLLQSKMEATGRQAIRIFFLSGGGAGHLPARFGYYLGYLVAQRAGQTRSLLTLSRLNAQAAHHLVVQTLGAMIAASGGCATGPIAQPDAAQ